MFQTILKNYRDRVAARRIKKYKSGEERFEYISKKLSTWLFPFDDTFGHLDTNKKLFIKSLKDDEIFAGLSFARGFQTSLNLAYLRESTQENFDNLLRLHSMRIKNTPLPRYIKKSKIEGSHDVILNYDASKYITNDPWCKLAMMYGRSPERKNMWRFKKTECTDSLFMDKFIEIWDKVFSEKTKARVIEILEDDESYFSVENIYTLSIIGYNEENSNTKEGNDKDFSIFETPTEWIQFILASNSEETLKI